MEPENLSPFSKQPTTWPNRSQVNHGQTIQYYFLNINFNITLLSAPRSSKWVLSPGFPTKTFYVFLFSSFMPHAFPYHPPSFNKKKKLMRSKGHADHY
jgi:hypothetical protein